MQIFISHSGERSRHVAVFLRTWLPKVNPLFSNVWVDKHSIEPGKPWSPELSLALAESHAGIVCSTPENTHAAWPIAEFSCLWKDEKIVVPYLVGGATHDRLPGPMQAARASIASDKEDSWNMVRSLSGDISSEDAVTLRARYEHEWPHLEAFLLGLGSSPIKEAVFDDPGHDYSGVVIKSWVDGIAKDNKPRSIQVKIFLEMATRASAVLGLMMITGLAFAFTKPGKDIATGLLQAITTSGAHMQNSNSVFATKSKEIMTNSTDDQFGTKGGNSPAGNLNRLAESNAYLSGQNQLMQQKPKSEISATSITSIVTNRMKETVSLEKNGLLYLPAEAINLRSILGFVGASPVPGDWLLFISTAATAKVELYSEPGTSPAIGLLAFGIPYKVISTYQNSCLQLEQSGSASQKPWLHGWQTETNAYVFRIDTNGLRIPNWRFLNTPEAPVPGITPARINSLSRPAAPSGLRVIQ